MKSKIPTLLIGSVFLFACCADEPANTNVNLNTNNAANEKSVDVSREKLFVSGVGATSIQNCSGREVEFDADSTGNDYVLRGECRSLRVDGVANKVEVEKVGEIEILGVSNRIIYGTGLDGKKPKIKKNGTDAAVESKETAKKNKKLRDQKEAEAEAKATKAANQNGL